MKKDKTKKVKPIEKEVIKEEPKEKGLRTLKMGQEILVKSNSHLERVTVTEITSEKAMLSNGILVNTQYNRKDRVIKALNLKPGIFELKLWTTELEIVWYRYILNCKIKNLCKVMADVNLNKLSDDNVKELGSVVDNLDQFVKTYTIKD